ncbi:MAG: 23S rRNA (guanosine(2251)-2'-O)-methyltransferase RlmB, partial [Bacteroidales bacterium]|nr:23S rRNA (guanosine(2251)-2'-O)-methyltransferase RlmB [Bacteroidales bacterium]
LRPVYEALAAGKEIEKVMIQKGLRGPMYAEVWQLIKAYDVPSQFVPVEKLNGLIRGTHQGIIAYLSPVEYQDIAAIIPMLFEQGEMPFLLYLDRITDVRNFGALARTASCSGVHALIVPARGSALITADAVKTSAGALHHLPVCRTTQPEKTLQFLRDSGVRVIAATEKTRKLYHTADLSGPVVVVMGSEEDGISRSILDLADERLAIPIVGEISSLNVSVAAGVLMYEVVRQRQLSQEG